MNVNVYLPDDLGKDAKAADLPLSRLLRGAVIAELERRAAVANSLNEVAVHEVSVEDNDGLVYTGRITGRSIGYNDHTESEVFLTVDGRVIAYDAGKLKHFVLDDPVEQLRGWLEPGGYAEAVRAIGEDPIIDL